MVHLPSVGADSRRQSLLICFKALWAEIESPTHENWINPCRWNLKEPDAAARRGRERPHGSRGGHWRATRATKTTSQIQQIQLPLLALFVSFAVVSSVFAGDYPDEAAQ